MKKIVLFDMDGVLVELGEGPFIEKKNTIGFFLNNKPMDGAIDAFKKLSNGGLGKCFVFTNSN
ncbi:hypothetical protein [Lacinutrix sp. MEBiC02404]